MSENKKEKEIKSQLAENVKKPMFHSFMKKHGLATLEYPAILLPTMTEAFMTSPKSTSW